IPCVYHSATRAAGLRVSRSRGRRKEESCARPGFFALQISSGESPGTGDGGRRPPVPLPAPLRSGSERLGSEGVAGGKLARRVAVREPALALFAGAVGEALGPHHAASPALQRVVADAGGG